MKITISLTDTQVAALKSYHIELDEPTTKSDFTATIQQWVEGLFFDDRCALSSHMKTIKLITTESRSMNEIL